MFFKEKVDNFKTSQKFFKDWQYKDGSSDQDKIISRVLVFLYWNMHSHNFDNN